MNARQQTSAKLKLLSFGVLVSLAIWGLPSSQAQGGGVQVSAADPPSAAQGTVSLNVRVTGKGFKNGARAKWFVTGTTDTGGVTVNSTTFVSSSEVTANITVADTAVIANFDIQVTNSDGRGGKGTELFAVTPQGGGNTCIAQATTACVTGSGCLDQTFNGNGQVLTNTDGTIPSTVDVDDARAVMAQSDGKLVAVGLTTVSFGTSHTNHVFIARYNSDGSLDNTFGDLDLSGHHTGISRVSVLHNDTIMYGGGAIYEDASGDTKILAAGYAQNYGSGVGIMFVLRLNSDGSLDTTFGDYDSQTSLRTGKKLIQLSTSTSTAALDIKPATLGGIPVIYLSGYGNNQALVYRLKDDGDLDNNFNGVGYVSLTHSALKLAVQADGKVVVGGDINTSKNQRTDAKDIALTRLTQAGQIDSTFGVNGTVRTDLFGFFDTLYGITLDAADRIVVAGATGVDRNLTEPFVARYSTSGQLQIRNTVHGSTSSALKEVVIQPDGKIVILGTYVDCGWSFSLTRFNATDLSVDTTFGNNGIVRTSFVETGAISALPQAMTIQLDPSCSCPKIIVSGAADTTAGYSLSIARFTP